jgi:polysaccharide biosynthesis protein PslH
MRILWVKANKILPLHSGGDIRSFNLLRQLAVHEQVTFFSYYDGEVDKNYEKELQEVLPGAVCVSSGKPLPRVLDYARTFFDHEPYAVGRFASDAVRKGLSECLTVWNPDLVICDFLDAAVNFPLLKVPVILFQHNVESEIWRRHMETAAGIRKRIYRREFARMRRYEEQTVKKFARVIAVSEHDRSLMSAWVDRSRIDVVPTGVDLARFRDIGNSNSSSSQPLVIFVGAMDWEPNIDAVAYFCASIWPAILSKVPDARFRIVGRNPDQRVRNLASATVEVTGSVPSVVDHLKQGAVIVVPLRIGGGTRLKIYEAMAAGKAVVATSIGAEGLDVHRGRDILLADDATATAEAVTDLLLNPELRHKFERAAQAQAAKFDWSAVAESFRQALYRCVPSATDERLQQLAADLQDSH